MAGQGSGTQPTELRPAIRPQGLLPIHLQARVRPSRALRARLVFHERRRAFATLALESGQLSMYELSVAMGHESEAVTNKVYAHLSKRDHSAKRAAFLASQRGIPTPVRQIAG